MNELLSQSGTGSDVIDGCLVVSLPGNIDSRSLTNFGRELLSYVRNNHIRKILINVSAIQVMDSYGFTILSKTARAISMLGGNTVFVGFQPGIVASLVDLDIPLDGVNTAINTEDAIELLSGCGGSLHNNEEKFEDDSIDDSSADAVELCP